MNITYPETTEYIDGLYRPLNQDFASFRAEAEADRVPIILRDSESFYLNIIRQTKPELILEIGTAVGYSASTFAAVSDAKIVSLEASEEMYKKANENISKFGFQDRIEVILGDARESLNSLNGTTFDIVFIDAAKSHYREFWDLVMPLTKKGSIILCDNILMKGKTIDDKFDEYKKYKTSIRRMRDFLEYITNLETVDTSILSVGDGISYSIVK